MSTRRRFDVHVGDRLLVRNVKAGPKRPERHIAVVAQIVERAAEARQSDDDRNECAAGSSM